MHALAGDGGVDKKKSNEGAIIQATEAPFNAHLDQEFGNKKEKNRMLARGG